MGKHNDFDKFVVGAATSTGENLRGHDHTGKKHRKIARTDKSGARRSKSTASAHFLPVFVVGAVAATVAVVAVALTDRNPFR